MKLVEQSGIIAVEPMEEAHALALFEKKLGMQAEGQDVAELVAAPHHSNLSAFLGAIVLVDANAINPDPLDFLKSGWSRTSSKIGETLEATGNLEPLTVTLTRSSGL